MTDWTPTPYTYNGTAIDGSGNYTGYFLIPDKYKQQEPTNIEVNRHYAPPVFVDKQLVSMDFELHIVMTAGTFGAGIAALDALFDVRSRTPVQFIVKNTSDSSKQYYRYVTPNKARVELPEYIVELHATDPVWKSVTQNSDAWSITASGQTHTIAIGGNVPTAPVIRIKATSNKTGGFGYKYYSMAYNPLTSAQPLYALEITGGLNTGALVANTAISNQINQGGGINNSVTTIPVDTAVGGGLPSGGGMAYVDTEQISYTANSGTSLTGVVRGINGTTAASHADNAVITQSLIQADGDDARVYVDGQEVNRWLGNWNASSSKVWVVVNFSPKRELTVAAMGSGDTTITIQASAANSATMGKKFPTSGSAIVDSEVISWTGITQSAGNADSGTLTGVKRGLRGSLAASHSAGATLRWLEHDIQFVMGNSASSAPTIDDTLKPIFALTGTNTSWPYTTNMSTLSGKRAGEWVGTIGKTIASANYRLSTVYTKTSTGSNPDLVDPSTCMGMSIKSWRHGTSYKDDNATMQWMLYNPAGFTTINPSGNTYRDSGVTWPTAKLQVSVDGKVWVDKITVSSPSTGWNSWSPGSTSLSGTYYYARFYFSGPVPAGAGAQSIPGNEADWEITSCTMTLDSSNVPQLTLSAQQAMTEIQCTLTNTDSGESIGLHYPAILNQEIEVDCENKTVKWLQDNTSIFPALSWSSRRQHWLDFAGNATVHLSYVDTGTNAVTLTTLWNDRQV